MNILNHDRHKHIVYDPEPHEYWFYPSGDKRKKKEAVQFDGITGWIGSFTQQFDAKKQAPKSAKNPNSEWYGMTVEDILAAWKEKGRVSMDRGNRIHKIVEDVVNDGVIEDGNDEIVDDFFNVMDKAGLEPMKSELVVYNEEVERATPIDLVCKQDGKGVVLDCKTYEDGMQWKAYGNKTFNYPLAHISDTKYMKTSIQCSIAQNWGERFYDTEFTDHGYILLYTNKFELIPALYLPEEVRIMEEWQQQVEAA